jgi:hypothetical protein
MVSQYSPILPHAQGARFEIQFSFTVNGLNTQEFSPGHIAQLLDSYRPLMFGAYVGKAHIKILSQKPGLCLIRGILPAGIDFSIDTKGQIVQAVTLDTGDFRREPYRLVQRQFVEQNTQILFRGDFFR